MVAFLGQLILVGALAVVIIFAAIVLFTIMIPSLRREYGIVKTDKKERRSTSIIKR